MLNSFKRQNGQIALITLLVIAVGLTIGLSVVGRSVTDIRFATQIDESGRAFSAAEAGIEEILSQGIYAASHTEGTIGDSNYYVDTSTLGGNSSIFAFPTAINDGDAQTIWLVPHNENGPVETPYYTAGSIEICWGKSGSGTPAVEAAVLFKSGSDYKIARAAYDPGKTDRSTENNFSDPDSGSCSQEGGTFTHHKTINFADLAPPPVSGDTLLALRLRPVYADAKIAVIPAQNLPEQGKNIYSTGVSASGLTRRWNVIQTYSSAIDIFDYAVWSNTGLSK